MKTLLVTGENLEKSNFSFLKKKDYLIVALVDCNIVTLRAIRRLCFSLKDKNTHTLDLSFNNLTRLGIKSLKHLKDTNIKYFVYNNDCEQFSFKKKKLLIEVLQHTNVKEIFGLV